MMIHHRPRSHLGWYPHSHLGSPRLLIFPRRGDACSAGSMVESGGDGAGSSQVAAREPVHTVRVHRGRGRGRRGRA